jgi:hypothetical protein
MADTKPFIQNEPVPYMDVQTLWNDRRDPHANPMSSSPRRTEGKVNPKAAGLDDLLHFLYRPEPGD